MLEKKGYVFESDTDTECVVKLTKYIFDSHNKDLSFTDLVKAVVKELEGSYAFIFKSKYFPNEVVSTRRGSPLLIGVKTAKKLKVDFVDVEFGPNPVGNDANCKCFSLILSKKKVINFPFLKSPPLKVKTCLALLWIALNPELS